MTAMTAFHQTFSPGDGGDGSADFSELGDGSDGSGENSDPGDSSDGAADFPERSDGGDGSMEISGSGDGCDGSVETFPSGGTLAISHPGLYRGPFVQIRVYGRRPGCVSAVFSNAALSICPHPTLSPS
jgi:hypothetical protein